jgi:hypothetical protein
MVEDKEKRGSTAFAARLRLSLRSLETVIHKHHIDDCYITVLPHSPSKAADNTAFCSA